MKTSILFATLIGMTSAASAQSYSQFPAPIPYQRAQHSRRICPGVFIPPYPRPFPIRIYSTPPQQPYYNVPPYAVVAPY